MAIRLKKWKQIVSFGALVLGVGMLAVGGSCIAERCFGYGRPDSLSEVFEQDYQKTGLFRWQMEDTFSSFLAMATGGYPGGLYGYGGYWGYDWEPGVYGGVAAESTAGSAIYWGTDSSVQETELIPWAISEEEAENYYIDQGIPDGTPAGGDEQARREHNEAAAKRYHESIREDQNVLYRISYDGKELYSNMGDFAWESCGDPLPDGYNFLFYFDGEKVTAMKDGEEIDIYGDGYYRAEGEQWYVPGYRNFTVDEDTKKARIVMLVAKEPADYVHVRYGDEGYARYGSSFYSVALTTQRRYRQMEGGLITLAVGAAITIVGLIGRKSRKEMNAAIGRFCGKIWFEPKALVLVLIAGSVVLPCFREYGYLYSELLFENYWDYGYTFTELSGELLQELVSSVLGRPGVVLALVWAVWFLALDLRANGKRFFRGGISRLMRCFEAKSLAMPYTKRMIRRFLLVMLVSLALILMEFAVVFSLAANGNLANFVWYYGGSAVLLFLIPVAGLIGVCAYYLVRTRRQTEELERISGRIRAIHDGDYGQDADAGACTELGEMEQNLNEIREGMEKAVEERMKSERMKVELVANVSHDIRTPLTSIISYVQFLKQEEGLPDHVKDYITILDEKSQRLNNMVQDVFAISKAASDQLPVKAERIDFGKLLRQTLADMDEQIRKSPVTVKAVIPEHEIAIWSDGSRMYRVFQNLIQNALQYSLEGSRVFIELREDASFAVACVKNVSSRELARGADFTERFVRGDESRTDGGSGLGLSIAKSFTEACGGRFEVETNADLFVVTVSFVRV